MWFNDCLFQFIFEDTHLFFLKELPYKKQKIKPLKYAIQKHTLKEEH